MENFYTELVTEKSSKYIFLHQKSVAETAPLHNHTYYEMFLVTKGKALHLVNGSIQQLKKGSLVFIRSHDIHKYDYYQEHDFEFINFTFWDSVVSDILNFLDDKDKFQEMLDSKYPPIINLSLSDTAELEKSVLDFRHQMNTGENNSESNSKNNSESNLSNNLNNNYKIYLLQLINNYFLGSYYSNIDNHTNVPPWLAKTILEMQEVENFSVGLDKMISISGYSQHHLNRQCRKYIGETPTNIINNNRIDYAAYLLKTSKLEILTIQQTVGFDSLSHFYHLFKKKFGVSPRQFRLNN